jgi:hypothetical protein
MPNKWSALAVLSLERINDLQKQGRKAAAEQVMASLSPEVRREVEALHKDLLKSEHGAN